MSDEPKQYPNHVIPNSYQTPNIMIDVLLPLLTDPEWRVLSFAMRHILGWREKIAARKGTISLSMFENGYGPYPGCGLNKGTIAKTLNMLDEYRILVKDTMTKNGQSWQLVEDYSQINIAALEIRLQNKSSKNKKRTETMLKRLQQKRGELLSDNTAGYCPTIQQGIVPQYKLNPPSNLLLNTKDSLAKNASDTIADTDDSSNDITWTNSVHEDTLGEYIDSRQSVCNWCGKLALHTGSAVRLPNGLELCQPCWDRGIQVGSITIDDIDDGSYQYPDYFYDDDTPTPTQLELSEQGDSNCDCGGDCCGSQQACECSDTEQLTDEQAIADDIACSCPTLGKHGECAARDDNSLACIECEWQNEIPGTVLTTSHKTVKKAKAPKKQSRPLYHDMCDEIIAAFKVDKDTMGKSDFSRVGKVANDLLDRKGKPFMVKYLHGWLVTKFKGITFGYEMLSKWYAQWRADNPQVPDDIEDKKQDSKADDIPPEAASDGKIYTEQDVKDATQMLMDKMDMSQFKDENYAETD